MNTLKPGDTIGIISPSWVADKNDYEKYAKGIEKLGFQIKFGKNIYKDTYKYTASVEERVNDLNEMIWDERLFWIQRIKHYYSNRIYISFPNKLPNRNRIFLV